jgi:ethanolamine permease
MTSLLSLFRLRTQEPLLKRPFRTPFYPWFPLIALGLSVLCTGAIVFYNQTLSFVFFASMLGALGVFWVVKNYSSKRLR